MASGWANDDAVNEQINSTIEDAVARVRGELSTGESLTECEECGEPIPEARRKAVPGVRLCLACQQNKDSHNTKYAGYNRRGSKDSQLR
ncbi:DksA/TraR family C4-type zinc finger protein [Enterobacteriaceae bacterium 155047]|uniref:DksA/TraR family C4-type zinc finger protein n=1 Tax=Huaxiibacter chinensis TaxID=2899785 RepID=UPI0007DA52A9|nr:DksA/TraR family C4-type zinc finger protein [Huaxiibacter chinensis]ANG92144.1 DksA/TraR family C4-type zinc finger protein [Lelliottia amnigena]MCG5043047.1 DksA/TraR family C4-type zinc finger protein [Huaxiibacter chinensis]